VKEGFTAGRNPYLALAYFAGTTAFSLPIFFNHCPATYLLECICIAYNTSNGLISRCVGFGARGDSVIANTFLTLWVNQAVRLSLSFSLSLSGHTTQYAQ
jgi:hypothetical protein